MKLLLPIIALMFSCNAYGQLTPQLVGDINPGAAGSGPYLLTTYNSQLYFAANNSTNGIELYRYSGSGAPTLVYDLNPGSGHSMEGYVNQHMGVMKGKLYFLGMTSVPGFRGTYEYSASGTPVLAPGVDSGTLGSQPYNFCTYGSKLYFSAYRAGRGYELFVYDGVNPVEIVDINPALNAGSNPSGLTPYKGKIYFSAIHATTGNELYAYDTAAKTVAIVKDIYAGSGSSNPIGLLVANGKLYFAAGDATYGKELYSFDGTTTTRLTDLTPGKGSGVYHQKLLAAATLYPILGHLKGDIYFPGATDSLNYHLYRYNSGAGTITLVKSLTFINRHFLELNGKLYFPAADTFPNEELWMTDGITTSRVSEINLTGGSSIRELYAWNNTLYFQASDGTHGPELYRMTAANGVSPVSSTVKAGVYPNPTAGDAKLSLSLRSPGVYSVDLVDAVGRQVWSTQQQLPEGTSSIDLPMAKLATGSYFYRIYDTQYNLNASGSVIRR